MTMSLLFYGVENWLLQRRMCGTKRLNPFFRLREASERGPQPPWDTRRGEEFWERGPNF